MPNFNKSKGFQLRSGNKANAPFKQMGASPANFGKVFGELLGGKKIGSLIDSGKDLLTGGKSVEELAITSTRKDSENHVIDSGAEPKEQTWQEKKSDFKDQKKDYRKTRKDFRKGNREEIAELKDSGASRREISDARKVNRQEQKDLRQSHRDDNKTAKQSYKSDPEYKAHKAEQRKQFSEALIDLGQSRTFQGKGAKSFFELNDKRKAVREANKKADANASAKKVATAATNKKDAIKEARASEMHKSKLALNKQNIAASQALEKQRLQGVQIAKENISEEYKLNPTDNKSFSVITGSGEDFTKK